MISKKGLFRPLLSVLTQFWNPGGSYRLLLNTRSAGIALTASVIVITASGYAPALLVDWNDFEAEWRTERIPELQADDMSLAQADSVAAEELAEIRQMAENLPMARLVERVVIALLGSLTAFGLVYAVEGSKFGRLMDYFTSSVLSQSAYMITGVLLILFLTLLDISPDIRLNLSAFVPVDTPDPTRMHVFIFRFLESIDLPSVVCLLIWGTGLSAMLERSRSWGLRLVFSVYVIGILLISLPVMFAPAA